MSISKINKKVFIAFLVIIAVIGIGLTIYNSPENRLNRQIDLGQKYLEEAKYEEAIVVFNQAIEIEPMSSEAYLGLAEAHIGLGDWEGAMEVLQKGYEMTGEEALQERKQELENEYAERRVSELEAAMDEKKEEFQRIFGVWSLHTSGRRHLTIEQLKEISSPYVELLKEYSSYRMQWKRENNQYWNYYYGNLADYYLACGEYDKCLEIREQAYEETGSEVYSTKERTEIQSGTYLSAYDQYGRNVYNESISDDLNSRHEHRYNDSGLLEESKSYGSWSHYSNGEGGVGDSFREYIYDEEKRIIEETWEQYFQDTGALYRYGKTEYHYHDSGFTVHYYQEGYSFGIPDNDYIMESDVDYTFNEYGEAIAGEPYNEVRIEKQ